LLLFKDLKNALYESIDATEYQKQLLMLECASVVLKISEAYREELANDDEAY